MALIYDALQDVYRGPGQEISMPASEFKMVSTQTRSVNLFPCTKYRHPKQLPTSRVLADYGVPSALRMTTTSILMNHGEKRTYTGHPKRAIIDSTVSLLRICEAFIVVIALSHL